MADDGAPMVDHQNLAVELGEEVEQRRAQRRKRRFVGAVVGGVLLLCAVAAAVAVAVVTIRRAEARPELPETFSVRYSAKSADPTPDEPSQYTGTLYKTVGADGTWEVSGTFEFHNPADDQIYRVTVKDNRAYSTILDTAGNVVQAGCVPEDAVPPYEDLKAAFDGATALTAVDPVDGMVQESCADQKKLVLSFAGETYIFCDQSGSITASHAWVGNDFRAELFDLNQSPSSNPIDTPVDASGKVMDCPVIDRTATATSRRRLREYAKPLPAEAHDWYQPGYTEGVQKRRLGAKRHCVFMHGLGQKSNSGVTTSFSSYWGNVQNYANCKSVKFLHRDTVYVGWENDALQQYFCDQAGGSTIKDTVIFSHSMGSLIVGGALGSGKCSLASSSQWFQINGPMGGSQAANMVDSICQNWWSAITSIVEKLGFCTSPPRTATAAIKEMKTNVNFATAQSAFGQYADGSMCGRSSYGLTSTDSITVSALDGIVDYGGDSDGVVSYSSCKSGTSRGYDDHYSKSYYTPKVNHMDGTCRHGNGWWGNDRKPCKWFDKMT